MQIFTLFISSVSSSILDNIMNQHHLQLDCIFIEFHYLSYGVSQWGGQFCLSPPVCSRSLTPFLLSSSPSSLLTSFSDSLPFFLLQYHLLGSFSVFFIFLPGKHESFHHPRCLSAFTFQSLSLFVRFQSSHNFAYPTERLRNSHVLTTFSLFISFAKLKFPRIIYFFLKLCVNIIFDIIRNCAFFLIVRFSLILDYHTFHIFQSPISPICFPPQPVRLSSAPHLNQSSLCVVCRSCSKQTSSLCSLRRASKFALCLSALSSFLLSLYSFTCPPACFSFSLPSTEVFSIFVIS